MKAAHRGGFYVTRLSLIPALAAASLLYSGAAGAQQPVPAAATTAPPPPPPPTVPGDAVAIQGVTPAYVAKPEFNSDSRKEGWDPRLSVGATGSFANNSNVAGQLSGSSFAFGYKLDAGMDYNHGNHEWRNSLNMNAGITRTPAIDAWFKTGDNVQVESIYLYHIVPWFGPFARGTITTSMFRGVDVRPVPATYVKGTGATPNPVIYPVANPDTTAAAPLVLTPDCSTGTCFTQIPLSDPFRPLTFKQSIGLFVQPYQTTPLTVELRGGAGAQEVLADNQLAVVTNSLPAATPNPAMPSSYPLSYQRLANNNQLGPEVALALWGSFQDKKVTYKINADAMTPLAHPALPPGDTRNAFALTNVQLDATVSFRLVDWASLDYQFKALLQPQVLDTFQIQNTLLLTFGLSFGGKPAAPPPCTPCAPPPPPPGPPPAPPPGAPDAAPPPPPPAAPPPPPAP
jgi:Protein of unknown function (DUF3078)